MAACFTGRCPKADEATLKMQRQQVEQAVKELGRIPIGEYSLACCIYRCGLNVCVRLSFTHKHKGCSMIKCVGGSRDLH